MTLKKVFNLPRVLAVLFASLHLFLALSVWSDAQRVAHRPAPNIALGPWSFLILLVLDSPAMFLMNLIAGRFHISTDTSVYWIPVVALCTFMYASLGAWLGKVLIEPEHNRRRTWR